MSQNFNPATEGKNVGNAIYHATITTGLTVGYAKLGKMILGGRYVPRFDFDLKDFLIATLDVTAAVMTKDFLIKQGILPADIFST